MIRTNPPETRDFSLPEVHESVGTTHTSLWKRLLSFAGPAYLVSVGYMDPGNWATDLEGGAKFGYRLLWVLVVSNLMALLLQTLSSRLGIVSRRDLAQACRDEYPRPIAYVLWILCEFAIVACDLAEVLGAAIGLNLLFHLPLLVGVAVTALDTLLVLWLSRLGIRMIEAFVLVLIATIAGCFTFEIFLAKPALHEVATGLIPHLNASSIYIAVAIFGATVMPHNLYLHSALVQTRRIGETPAEVRTACRFNLFDSALALNAALFVNAAILVMAAAVFFKHNVVVTEIQQAHQLLAPLLGTTLASLLFGAALLCSGQASTLTGTMAGQIVMEGFLRLRMQPWLRRAITRSLAIIPAALTIYFAGESATYSLMILSQVVLSLQLPFAVIPLVYFTSDRRRMGEFANGIWVKVGASASAIFILALNTWLLWDKMNEWVAQAGSYRPIVLTVGIAGGLAFLALLGVVVGWPWFKAQRRIPTPVERVSVNLEKDATPVLRSAAYTRILVPLDHSEADQEAINNALALARMHDAKIILLHVEEGVTSQMFGSMASTAEVNEGQAYLTSIETALRDQGVGVEVVVRHGKRPVDEIVAAVADLTPDLIVMGSHGHSGIKDLIFGTTINAVRHKIKVPMMIVSKS
jgi:manganese transport protein